MARTPENLLTASEAAFVAGMAVRTLYRIAADKLPAAMVRRRNSDLLLTRRAAVCARLDRELPADLPRAVRRRIFAAMAQDDGADGGDVTVRTGRLCYVVDTRASAAAVARELDRYRRACAAIIEDPDIQGGAATLKGTRLLVHHLADLVAQGVAERELFEDYPALTPELLDAACVYAKANPRRGRPRTPGWRNSLNVQLSADYPLCTDSASS